MVYSKDAFPSCVLILTWALYQKWQWQKWQTYTLELLWMIVITRYYSTSWQKEAIGFCWECRVIHKGSIQSQAHCWFSALAAIANNKQPTSLFGGASPLKHIHLLFCSNKCFLYIKFAYCRRASKCKLKKGIPFYSPTILSSLLLQIRRGRCWPIHCMALYIGNKMPKWCPADSLVSGAPRVTESIPWIRSK